MTYSTVGRVLSGVGGLYAVALAPAPAHTAAFPGAPSPLAGRTLLFRARGILRKSASPLAGDMVRVEYTDESVTAALRPEGAETSELPDAALVAILPRRNCLIRPPLANLDIMFVTLAAAAPKPSPETVDKVLSVAEYHGIEAAVVIGKRELDEESAASFAHIYTLAGYPVFSLSCADGRGVGELAAFVAERLPGRVAAFAGASGVGKSTLISALFPGLSLKSGAVSAKNSRGRHTTRATALYPVTDYPDTYIADTPGFSLIDFAAFDFFPFEALPDTMREFAPYTERCRWPDCTHTREEECGVRQAVNEGLIAPSRHESYIAMYDVLKNKHSWDKKQ